MAKVIVDGTEVDVPADYTIMQACEAAGAEIPRFCYHERLSIAGNCRMCLVEVKGAPKPVASCAQNVRDLRPGPNGEPPVINTTTPVVKKAREGVMEFLLINHPLDCPICDQGGECDLQDQSVAYGMDHSRFHETKRAVEDKYIGPLVKTVMTRCIHCTRCVRFTTEVAGITELGLIGRGEDAEITTYLEQAMTSEMQGNVVDLCPVGALTAKPSAFNARPWELTKTESTDMMDAVGSSIRIDTRGREVIRILPRQDDAVNEEWISDKTRHVADGLRTQRLDQPYLRENGRLRPASWREALAAVAAKVKATSANKIGALAGDLATLEELFALKSLMAKIGSPNLDARTDGSPVSPAAGRATYLFNPGIAGIEEADAILLVGTNPRYEAAILNARIRKRYRMGGLKVALIGANANLNYPFEHLGAGVDTLADIASGKNAFAEVLKSASKPLVIVGQGALQGADAQSVLALAIRAALAVNAVKDGWTGFGVIQTAASRAGALDLGFVPGEGGLDAKAMAAGGVDVLFSLGADETDVAAGPFLVYIGSHGDKGAHRADVILPGAAYTEKAGLTLNLEGRVRQLTRAAFPPGLAKEDWAILRALSAEIGQTLPFDSLGQLRAALLADKPDYAVVNKRVAADPAALAAFATSQSAPASASFAVAVPDFYLTNPIARASGTMAECANLLSGALKTAAE